ncbi:phosphotransferase [Actinosynnema sp. NPDC023587]|uniref:phosphotransferase n=1 Tax=Actinosynnema sp. NPDC023587 TaxID=3154695 RepID=UPI0034071B55
MGTALGAVRAVAGRLGLPVDDVEVLRDDSNLLVHLRPAPVVARVGAVTAAVRGDVFGHFARADAVSRFLAGRGVPVVEPVASPVREGGWVVALAAHVPHSPEWTPDSPAFALMLRELHRELAHFTGELPARGPVDDIDAVLTMLGRPDDLVAERDALVAAWPDQPVQALHGDAHPHNVLATANGPVWNDFEDTWRGPVGWDVACAAGSRLLDRAAVARAYPADLLDHWLGARRLLVRCWRAATDLHRARSGV